MNNINTIIIQLVFPFFFMNLDLYRIKRKIGRGGFGEVVLAEDNDGKNVAIKMISKKHLVKQPYLKQYIENQKQCMMSLKSKYLMELYDVKQDSNFYYFLCEYCSGGDLKNYQAKQENKVFSMDKTVKILCQIIYGLSFLHSCGYLHRDIKSQNILIQKTKYGEQIKLADFGFTKKLEDICGTMVGTEGYMSPEILNNEIYGSQVDIWAFGVLMYFMLNMEFPFRVNPHLTIPEKKQELISLCKNFSYRQSVSKTRKKLMENCTENTEDFFKRIFEPESQKRIKLQQIKKHPIFCSYFGEVKEKISRKKIKSLNPLLCNLGGEKNYSEQIKRLEEEIQKLDFFSEIIEQLSRSLVFLNCFEVLCLRYNLLKYYIVLNRDLKSKCRSIIAKQYPKKNWDEFFSSEHFVKIQKQIKERGSLAELKISITYDFCLNNISDIKKFNPKIEQIMEDEVKETEFTKSLKQCYRTSTVGVYEKVRSQCSLNPEYYYIALLVTICHSFNKVLKDNNEGLRVIFESFVKQKKVEKISFLKLKSWLSKERVEENKKILKQLIKRYFV